MKRFEPSPTIAFKPNVSGVFARLYVLNHFSAIKFGVFWLTHGSEKEQIFKENMIGIRWTKLIAGVSLNRGGVLSNTFYCSPKPCQINKGGNKLSKTKTNIISGTAGGRKFQKTKHIEPIEMERLWFDVTHLFEELLLAFDWLPDQPN